MDKQTMATQIWIHLHGLHPKPVCLQTPAFLYKDNLLYVSSDIAKPTSCAHSCWAAKQLQALHSKWPTKAAKRWHKRTFCLDQNVQRALQRVRTMQHATKKVWVTLQDSPSFFFHLVYGYMVESVDWFLMSKIPVCPIWNSDSARP